MRRGEGVTLIVMGLVIATQAAIFLWLNGIQDRADLPSRQPSGQIGTTAPERASTEAAEPASIKVNGLRVTAKEGMDWLSEAKILEAARFALETTKGGPSFATCPPVIISLVGEKEGRYPGSSSLGHYWHDKTLDTYNVELKRRSEVGTPVTKEAWRQRLGEDPLRHEFFHHYLEADACGTTFDEKAGLFKVSHQVAYSGINAAGEPRWCPNNDDWTSPDCKYWLGGGEYRYRAGEDWAEMLHEMYDGEDDGYGTVYAPNLDGRKKAAAAEARDILGL